MVLAGGMIARSECLQAGKPAAEKSIPQSVVQSRQESHSYQATEHRGRLNLSCLQTGNAARIHLNCGGKVLQIIINADIMMI